MTYTFKLESSLYYFVGQHYRAKKSLGSSVEPCDPFPPNATPCRPHLSDSQKMPPDNQCPITLPPRPHDPSPSRLRARPRHRLLSLPAAKPRRCRKPVPIGEGPSTERREAEGPPRRPSLDVVVHTRAIVLASPRSAEYPKATHIYTVSITYFVIRFCDRFFKTRSITHATGINIYIYTRTYVQDGMEMRRNLFVDLLAHERNEYRRFLPADIKYYLSRITERSIQQSL